VDRKAIRAVKARIRRLTAWNWGVSRAHRVATLNRFVTGGAPTSPGPRPPRSSPSLMSGSAGGCASARGSSGSACGPASTGFGRWASLGRRPSSGPTAARAPGASRGRPCSNALSPTPTGRAWASSASPGPTVASGLCGEPPDAWSACPVVWEEAGQPRRLPDASFVPTPGRIERRRARLADRGVASPPTLRRTGPPIGLGHPDPPHSRARMTGPSSFAYPLPGAKPPVREVESADPPMPHGRLRADTSLRWARPGPMPPVPHGSVSGGDCSPCCS
jgi:hypothetical protein